MKINKFLNVIEINVEERVRTEQALRMHWHDDSICMIELIREEYDGENASAKGNDDGQEVSIHPNETKSTVDHEATALFSSTIDDKKRRESLPPKIRNYYVIVDYDLDLDWVVDNELRTDIFEKVLSEISIIKTIPHTQLGNTHKLQLMRLLGNALVAAIHNQEDEAKKLLFEGRKFILDRLSEASRLWSLATATILLAVIILIHAGVGYWLCNYDYPAWWFGCAWGVIGAYLSIALKIGKERRDAEVGINLHILNVFVKFISASIMGSLACLMLRNGHILPPALLEVGKDINGSPLVGFLCGFCENLIPNLVSALPKEK